MENNVLEPIAYHEAGRVMFAYLSGFTCDSMELSGGGSKLNSGNDVAMVQAVFSGNPLAVPADQINHTVDVAKRLMTIECAGTCANVFYQNGGSVPEELDVDIPAQNFKNIEKIQAYLKKAIIDHPDDFPMRTIVSVFKKLKDPSTWNGIQLLATKILGEETNSLSRFYVEDTLMLAGINVRRAATTAGSGAGFSVGVREDETPRPAAQQVKTSPVTPQAGAPVIDLDSITPLYIMQRDFLKRIKKDWRENELDEAIAYINDLHKKYGDN